MEIKRNIQKWKLLVGIVVLMLGACKKDDSDSLSVNLPVVEAYLMPGRTITVKIYQQKSLTDTAKYGKPITGLHLSVSNGSNSLQLSESAKGVYTDSDQSFLKTGKTYQLQFIQHQGRLFIQLFNEVPNV